MKDEQKFSFENGDEETEGKLQSLNFLSLQSYKERGFDRNSIWKDNGWEFPKTEGKHGVTDSSVYMNDHR